MTQKVEVAFGLAFIQLINVVSIFIILGQTYLCRYLLTNYTNVFFVAEWKKSDYEVECLAAIGKIIIYVSWLITRRYDDNFLSRI